jgi:uncharacterized protein YdaU (DUF1376 family)
MVAFFKHDIPAWMDGTEALDDGPYRAYHVICQLIYQCEGPVTLNEHGIAGRCKQSIRSFRANLKVLLDLGKLTLSDGRLTNSRAEKELEKICENRVNASEGGKKSGEVRKSAAKPLKNNNTGEAPLQEDRSLKTRLEETREENKDAAGAALASSAEVDYFRRIKEIIGPSAGGLGKKLLDAKGSIPLARAAVEQASTKENAREYLGAIIRNRDGPDVADGRSF